MIHSSACQQQADTHPALWDKPWSSKLHHALGHDHILWWPTWKQAFKFRLRLKHRGCFPPIGLQVASFVSIRPASTKESSVPSARTLKQQQLQQQNIRRRIGNGNRTAPITTGNRLPAFRQSTSEQSPLPRIDNDRAGAIEIPNIPRHNGKNTALHDWSRTATASSVET